MYHPTVNKILTLLNENNIWFETFEHEAVRTSEEAAAVRHGYSLNQGAKALIVKIKSGDDSKFVMLVIPGNFRFDNLKVKKYYDTKDLRFASPEEVATLTEGIEPGGVPPFGNLFGLEVLCDPKVLENEKIIFNAGDRRFSVAMKSSDYMELANPKVTDIT